VIMCECVSGPVAKHWFATDLLVEAIKITREIVTVTERWYIVTMRCAAVSGYYVGSI